MKAHLRSGLNACLALALLAAGARAGAAQDANAPLPEFSATSLGELEVPSDRLSSRERWLLIYVQPNCKPCERVLRVFQMRESQPDYTDKVIILVGGATVEQVRQLSAQMSWLPESSWYADTTKNASTALDVKGAPVVYGVQRNNIEWSLVGSLAKQDTLQSILSTWFQE